MKFLSAKGLVLGGALLSFAIPSHAVMLKQKWQAGQKLTYALDLDGTANVQLPPGAPGMDLFAGVPLELQMRGTGLAELNTLKVDEFGTGTVTVALPQLKLNAQALGQKAQWTMMEGKSQLSINGQPLGIGAIPQGDGKPTAAIKISATGQFKGIESLVADKPAPQVATQNPVTPGAAIDKAGAFSAMILSAFPALWPTRDVNVGDTWQANVDFAPLARPAKDDEAAKPLGSFDLKMEGEDVVEGKTLQRVSIKGDVDLDGKTLETAFPTPPVTAPAGNATKAKPQQPQPKLDHANQTVEGTLWFDAQAGQVAKAELVLGGRAQAITPNARGNGNESWFDFTGSLNMALQPK
ncbi:hypothetical protein IAD21_03224 [Abditibacteriota bacterium]|nr:hypothetical protein IAD21_03224 [Abditibacteriota bacterium]